MSGYLTDRVNILKGHFMQDLMNEKNDSTEDTQTSFSRLSLILTSFLWGAISSFLFCETIGHSDVMLLITSQFKEMSYRDRVMLYAISFIVTSICILACFVFEQFRRVSWLKSVFSIIRTVIDVYAVIFYVGLLPYVFYQLNSGNWGGYSGSSVAHSIQVVLLIVILYSMYVTAFILCCFVFYPLIMVLKAGIMKCLTWGCSNGIVVKIIINFFRWPSILFFITSLPLLVITIQSWMEKDERSTQTVASNTGGTLVGAYIVVFEIMLLAVLFAALMHGLFTIMREILLPCHSHRT